jgi:chorismate mutase/prephenate dehydratase
MIMENLGKIRKKIDLIDVKITSLLQQRAENSKRIADVKNRLGQKVYDPAREAQVLANVKKTSMGRMTPEMVASVYNEIFSASRALQKKVSVAYLGPIASYSHLAAIPRFGNSTDYIPVDSIRDVFMEVEKDNSDYGCVPIENSTEGGVNYTYDMFADSELSICSEMMLEIKHNLLSNAKSFEAIKTVYVHPQTRAQCRRWLETNLPHADLVEVSSNSKSALLAAKSPDTAGIASELASQIYGIKIMARAIQDSTENFTRFFVIGKQINKKSGDDKTTMMVSIKDKVGALYHLLKPFQKYKVNLTNIESRPSKKKAWDYYFFVDFLGHKDDPRIKKAITEVEKECGSVKILGSYPRF